MSGAISGCAETEPVDTVVLGGGVCGLYAALCLARRGLSVLVLEKDTVAGGLAAGRRRGRNHYDLGVHMLHAFDAEIFADLSALMGEERIEVALDARIRWAGGTFRYPLELPDILRGMPATRFVRCCAGLFAQTIRNRWRASAATNAAEALIQLYGEPLYRFFFRDFTHRYWGVPPQQLSAQFVAEKMPRLSAFDALRKVLDAVGVASNRQRSVASALRQETLHYSRTGAEALPRQLVAAIESHGGVVRTAAAVTGVRLCGRRVEAVEYRDADSARACRVACGSVISTIPIPDFVSAMGDAVPAAVAAAAAALRYKPIAVYGLLVAREKCLDGLYVYFRDRVFHRVGEPKNAGMIVDPADHTLLIVETTCEIGDARWRGDANAVADLLSDLEAEGICRRGEIVETHLLTAAHAYPLYALGFEAHRDLVAGFIDSLENAQSTGRQGSFTYPNMHGAMRMGAGAAARIATDASPARCSEDAPHSR